MSIRLSNSSTNMLETCGEMYRFHYEERIRSRILGSALMFGAAMDLAFNELLAEKMQIESLRVPKDKALENAKKAFDQAMTLVDVNGEKVDPIEYEYMQYSKADLDFSLLEDISEETIVWVEEYQKNLKFKGFKPAKADQLAYHRLCYESLYKKGLMLIDYYQQEVMPQIDYVVSIQQQVELPNENGDRLVGVIDAVGKFVGDDKVYIVDNKTASKPYKESELYESKQLATYAEYMQNPNVAYIVVEKELRKKEPRIRHTILKGTLSEEHIGQVFVEYEKSLEKIRNKSFDKNESKCYNHFGRRCAFLSICKNGTMDKTLVKLGEKV